MKIRLNRDLPVIAAHGMRKGRVLKVVGEKRKKRIGSVRRGGRLIGYWVHGDTGKRVCALVGEFDQLGEDEMQKPTQKKASRKKTPTKKAAPTKAEAAVKQLIEKGAKVLRINPAKIKDDWRARKDYGDIKELAADIRSNGQMQPILIRKHPKGDGFLIIAGARRLRACKELKTLVRAIVVKPSDELEALTLQLAENIMRKNFEALEAGEGFKRHKRLYEKAHPETKHGGPRGDSKQVVKSTTCPTIRYTLAIAQQMGVSESKIQKLLQLSELPAEEKAEIAAKKTARERNKAAADKLADQRKRKKEEQLAAEAEERQAERKAKGSKAKPQETESAGTVFGGTWESNFAAIEELGPYDLCFPDPPYGEERSLIQHATRSNITKNISAWDQLDVGWVLKIAPLMAKTGQMLVFCPLEAIGDYQSVFDKAGMKYRGAMIWHKTNPGTAHRPVYLSSLEAIVWATMGTSYHFPVWKNAGKPEVHNFREGPLCGGKERLDHPTQKPLWLVEELLLRHTAKGDTVLDPFMGVGTTLVAARRHGRVSVGVEKSKKYIRLAKMRLQAVK